MQPDLTSTPIPAASTRTSPGARLPWKLAAFLFLVFCLAEGDLPYLTGTAAAPAISQEESSVPEVVEATRDRDSLASVEDAMEATQGGDTGRRVALLALGALGAVSLYQRWPRGRVRIRGLPGTLILLFGGLAATSVAWSDEPGLTLRRVVALAMLWTGAIGSAERLSLRQMIWVAFLGSGLFVCLGLVAEVARGKFAPWSPSWRFVGQMSPNAQGWASSVLFLAALGLAGAVPRRRRWFLALAAASFLLVAATRSRTCMGGCLVAGLSFAFLTVSRTRMIAAICWVVVISCALCLVFGPRLLDRAEATLLLGRKDTESVSSLTGRVPLWQQCFEYISQRPLLGHGYGAFWSANGMGRISDMQNWLGAAIPNSHNGYIDLMLDVGLFGACLYVGALLLALAKSWSLYRTRRHPAHAFAVAVLVFYLASMTLAGNTFTASFLIFVCILWLARLGFVTPCRPAGK